MTADKPAKPLPAIRGKRSRYSGADLEMPSTWANYGRGARARVKALKRHEAEQRNAATPIESTAKFRRDRARVQAALAEAKENRP